MKINEASVIDNKVIDEMIAELEQSGDMFNQLSLKSIHRLELLKQLKQHLKPLEVIIMDDIIKETCI